MAEKTHFDLSKKRFETKGINTRLPIEYRFLLWQLIDELGENMPLDYLQVFEFRNTEEKCFEGKQLTTQNLIHSQEQPEYTKTYTFPIESPINGKVYVIDDGDHCTMLLAEEY